MHESGEEHLWAIVLAGGEGARLGSVAGRRYGRERPKQNAVLSARSLLGQTLDRVARLVPPYRTVVVTLASHRRYLAAELADRPGLSVLSQPSDRGTAAGFSCPCTGSTLATPCDRGGVSQLITWSSARNASCTRWARRPDRARDHPERLILLGAPPTEPESGIWMDRAGRAARLERQQPAIVSAGYWKTRGGRGSSTVRGWLPVEHLCLCVQRLHPDQRGRPGHPLLH